MVEPAPGVDYPVVLGKSITERLSSLAHYRFRYNFKPSTLVANEREAHLHVQRDLRRSDKVMIFPDNPSGEQVGYFEGKCTEFSPGEVDLVAIFDGQQWVLECCSGELHTRYQNEVPPVMSSDGFFPTDPHDRDGSSPEVNGGQVSGLTNGFSTGCPSVSPAPEFNGGVPSSAINHLSGRKRGYDADSPEDGSVAKQSRYPDVAASQETHELPENGFDHGMALDVDKELEAELERELDFESDDGDSDQETEDAGITNQQPVALQEEGPTMASQVATSLDPVGSERDKAMAAPSPDAPAPAGSPQEQYTMGIVKQDARPSRQPTYLDGDLNDMEREFFSAAQGSPTTSESTTSSSSSDGSVNECSEDESEGVGIEVF